MGPGREWEGSSLNTEWSRRRFLRGTGALGLLTLAGTRATPALAGTLARTRPRARPGAVPADCPPGNQAKLGVFAEPEGAEKGYFGAFMGYQDEVYQGDSTRGAAIYRSYRSWGKPIFNSTIDSILNPAKNPYVPPEFYFSFHAFYDSKGNNPIQWSDITAGVYDGVIDTWANQLKQLGGAHTYVCFHHEMENEEGKCGTNVEFIAAYWYFRQRIESPSFNNVPNLTWVVTYMRDTFAPPLKHGGPERWWPSGSPYSDILDDHLLGVDIYNRNMCHFKGWRTFGALIDHAHQFSLDKGRRFFIGECGSVEGDACNAGGTHGIDKAGWFQDALTEMTSSSWSNLEALCYSDVTGFGGGGYRIDTSPESLDAYRALANDCLFTG